MNRPIKKLRKIVKKVFAKISKSIIICTVETQTAEQKQRVGR